MAVGANARIALLLAAVTGASAFAGGTPDPEQPHNFAPGSPHWQHERGPLFATFNPTPDPEPLGAAEREAVCPSRTATAQRSTSLKAEAIDITTLPYPALTTDEPPDYSKYKDATDEGVKAITDAAAAINDPSLKRIGSLLSDAGALAALTGPTGVAVGCGLSILGGIFSLFGPKPPDPMAQISQQLQNIGSQLESISNKIDVLTAAMSFLQATANEILGEVKELKQWLEYGFKDMHAVGADYEVAMTRFKDAQATKAASDFNQYVSYFFEPQIAKWEEYRFQYYRQGSKVESLLTFGLRTSSDNKKRFNDGTDNFYVDACFAAQIVRYVTVSRIQLYILLSQAASFQDCVDAGGRANYFKGCVSNTSTTKLLRLADDLHADLKYYQDITDPAFGINKGVLDATDDHLVAFATGKKKEVVFWAWDPAGTKSANPNTFNTNGTLRPVLSLLDEPKSCPHKPPYSPVAICYSPVQTASACFGGFPPRRVFLPSCSELVYPPPPPSSPCSASSCTNMVLDRNVSGRPAHATCGSEIRSFMRS